MPEITIITGRAPDALAGLPVPDAVFIGGGAGDGTVDRAGLWPLCRWAGGWWSTP